MRLTPLADSLPSTVPFVGPEALERRTGIAFELRLGANESGFGPAPSVQRAIADAIGGVWTYGEPENDELKRTLAAHHGIEAHNIVVGEGIDGLLGTLVRLTVEAGVTVVTSDGAYPTFNYHVVGCGGSLHKVAYRDDHEDLDALEEAARKVRPALVYLANPDNPMGTWHEGAAVSAFAARLPPGTVLCLDEAYCQTAPPAAIPPILPIADNVIRMRTFSKAYGLAGLRIGYAIGPQPLIAAFDRLRNHFGVNKLAQVAAVAAVADHAHLDITLRRIDRARGQLSRIAIENGLKPIESATNFVTMDCGHDGAFARALVDALGQRGVFVRMPMVAPLDRCIRVSAAPPGELDRFAELLAHAVREVRARGSNDA